MLNNRFASSSFTFEEVEIICFDITKILLRNAINEIKACISSNHHNHNLIFSLTNKLIDRNRGSYYSIYMIKGFYIFKLCWTQRYDVDLPSLLH